MNQHFDANGALITIRIVDIHYRQAKIISVGGDGDGDGGDDDGDDDGDQEIWKLRAVN